MPDRPAPVLFERLVAVHEALDAAGFDHAIGGAIALGVHTRDPRFTSDLDLNVLADPEHPEDLLESLPEGLGIPPETPELIRRDGFVRLLWHEPETPVDLFLPQHPEYHQLVCDRASAFAFPGADIKVISATDLIIFKTMFGRSKDWVDIESLIASEPDDLDLVDARRWLVEVLGEDHGHLARLNRLVADLGHQLGEAEPNDPPIKR